MMSPAMKGVSVLAVQMALVLSVAAKYGWERKECPQVWVQVQPVDPEQPLRGRYLALAARVDGCGLPKDGSHANQYAMGGESHTNYNWEVTTVARGGKLVAVVWDGKTAEPTEHVSANDRDACADMRLEDDVEFFVSEKVETPAAEKGQQMWALVTVPPQGPPRPVELAVSDAKGWRVLQLR